ncbi:hypothetical protein [Marinomonas sp. FW-1]|uniref:hypothetical protein n=1 Tax=Marinomonas sp. FW-1 TaxID=2071621 RepID=UPI0010C11FA0|nr:hypothetical protein [Marinomonas sp. FW-1]
MFKLYLIFLLNFYKARKENSSFNTIGSKNIILSRTACLGNEIFERGFSKKYKRINFPKSRVDHILDGSGSKNNILKLIKYFNRLDILSNSIYMQNNKFLSKRNNIKYIMIDSFSELTDQRFYIESIDSTFYCNYGDLKKECLENNEIKCFGNIDLDDLHYGYLNFLNKVKETYPGVKVIFIHFPTALETRKEYIERAEKIFHIIESLKKDFPFLISLSVSPEKVLSASKGSEEYKKLPYHYDESVYEEFIALLRSSGVIDYNE